MILASSDEGDVVLDPFFGSGTLLRVCQNTNRNGIGIDKSRIYSDVKGTIKEEKFLGFDSIDERMKRVPNDFEQC